MALDPSFWERERRLFEAAFAGMTIDILLASGEAGAAALPLAYRGLVDWDLFNQAALDWSRLYFGSLDTGGQFVAPGAKAWAKALNETTRRQFMREFEAWIVSGEPLPAFEARIAPLFSKARAGRIAATEVTRIYDAGNMAAWGASGVVNGTVWQTARDERVCPICRPLHGKLIDIGDGYRFSGESLAQSAALRRAVAAQGGLIWGPPGHISCLLPGTLVTSPGSIRYATKSFYHGRAIEVRTRGGRVLTVTENHPILTGRGWIAAQFLTESDHVFSSAEVERIATAVNPNDNHVPTAIEQIFSSLYESSGMSPRRVPVSAEDFHGDGRAMNGDVDIVSSGRFLQGDIISSGAYPFSEFALLGSSLNLGSLSSGSGLHQGFDGRDSSLRGGMSGGDLPLPLGSGHVLPFERFGFDLIARRDSVALDSFPESPSANSEFIGEGIFGFTGQVSRGPRLKIGNGNLIDTEPILMHPGGTNGAGDGLGADTALAGQFIHRFPGLIAADNVVKIRQFDFSGHVYNLQVDPYGLYFANEIIAHNCRCHRKPVVFDAYLPEEIEAMRWRG